jgi:hypothetical protein
MEKGEYPLCEYYFEDLEKVNAALRAEVERLRGEVEESACLYRDVRDEAIKSRSDLAAAAKVLREAHKRLDHASRNMYYQDCEIEMESNCIFLMDVNELLARLEVK